MVRGGARCWVRPREPRPREPLLLCTNFRFSDSHNLRVRSNPSSHPTQLLKSKMTIKLVLLKSNEEVIADVTELVDNDDKTKYIVLGNPYCCKLVENPELLTEDTVEGETTYSVQYYPWMPLTSEKRIPISPDWVVAITEPCEMVMKSYTDRMKEKEDG